MIGTLQSPTDIILTATWQKNETPKPVFYTVKFDTGNGSKD